MTGAERAHLLVIGEHQDQRSAQPREIGLGGEVRREGEKAFHVAGAAGHPAVTFIGEGERIAAPAGLLGGDRVHVAGEHKPLPVAAGSGAQPNDQVRFRAVRRRVALDPSSWLVEVIGEKVRQRQIGIAAGRVERDQAGEKLGVGEVRGHGQARIIGLAPHPHPLSHRTPVPRERGAPNLP